MREEETTPVQFNKFPKELWKQVKSELALRGMNTTEGAIEALRDFVDKCRKERG